MAYNSLLLERRRGLHARLVEALEALAPERVAAPVERLAHHALRGEVWDKAVTYGQQAGARACDRAVFREAVTSFDRPSRPSHTCPKTAKPELAIDLRLALGSALTTGEYGRGLALLGEAEALARALDDRARLGRVLAGMARVAGERETPTAPWRRASRPSSSRSRSAIAPCRRKSIGLGQA